MVALAQPPAHAVCSAVSIDVTCRSLPSSMGKAFNSKVQYSSQGEQIIYLDFVPLIIYISQSFIVQNKLTE